MSIAACFPPTCAFAGFDEGTSAYVNGNFGAALKEWSIAAEAGDGDAQYNLGCMFLRGEGTPPDLVRGAEWLQKAGQRDISDALVWALSRGTPTDEERKRLFSTKNLGSGKFHRNRDRAAAGKGGHMSIPFEKLKARLLANPKVKAEYEALAPEFEIAGELLRARRRAGLSQAQLAARMGTSQSTIARLESGQTLPSTKTLLRYAEATGSRFRVRLPAA